MKILISVLIMVVGNIGQWMTVGTPSWVYWTTLWIVGLVLFMASLFGDN